MYILEEHLEAVSCQVFPVNLVVAVRTTVCDFFPGWDISECYYFHSHIAVDIAPEGAADWVLAVT